MMLPVPLPFRRLRDASRRLAMTLLLPTLTASAIDTREEKPVPPLAERYAEAVKLLNSGDTQISLQIFAELVAWHGGDATVRIGPAFGNLYYHMGIALDHAGNLDGAIEAFKQCYLHFGNREDRPESKNLHHGHALLKWAELEQQLGRSKNATRLLARALRENLQDVEREILMYNLAAALESAGDTRRALKFYNLLLGGDKSMNPSAEVRRKSFLSLARTLADRGEIERVRDLLKHYEHLLDGNPVERYGWTPDMLHLGRRCAFAGDPLLALRCYRYAAHPEDVIQQLQERLALTPAEDTDETSSAVQFMRTEQARNRTGSALLKARAGAFLQLDLFRLALPAYERLLRDKNLGDRDDVLYATTICAARAGRPDDAARYAAPLLDRTPPYFRHLEVAGAWAQSLLDSDRFDEAHAIAETYRNQAGHGNPEREGLDFIAAASLFQANRFTDALEAFGVFLRDHENSDRTDAAAYYQALAAVRAERWKLAERLLDAFLAAHHASDRHDGALYFRAMTHAVQQEDPEALVLVQRIEAEHPDSNHLPAALNLKGDISFRQSQWPEAEEVYHAAIRATGSPPGAGEETAYAKYQLIRIAEAKEDWNEVRGRYDSLRAKSPDNAYLARGSILAARARDRQGDTVGALELLTSGITQHGKQWRDPDLPRLLTAYHELYERENGRDELLHRLRNFPGPIPDPLRAWLLVGVVETLESAAEISSVYAILESDFDPRELDSPILLKLASWFVSSDVLDRAASSYRIIVEERPDDPERNPARVALARALMKAHAGSDLEEAYDLLMAAGQEVTEPTWVESVALETARAQVLRKRWAQAEADWRKYVSTPEWAQARAEANYELARCIDMQDRKDEALQQYTVTYVQYEGHIEWSSRAFLRAALMLEEAGERRKAFAVLDDMMNRLGTLSHPYVNRARTLHRRWQQDASFAPEGKRS